MMRDPRPRRRGIRAFSLNTAPVGSGDTARGNDDPAECFPAIC